MTAQEMKALTGAATKSAASQILYERLNRRTWTLAGESARLAGYDQRTDMVHFTQTEAAGTGCCFHRRVGVMLTDAIDCISGNVSWQDVAKVF